MLSASPSKYPLHTPETSCCSGPQKKHPAVLRALGAHLQDGLQPGYQGLHQLSSLEWFPTKTGFSSKTAVVCFFPLERYNLFDKSIFLKSDHRLPNSSIMSSLADQGQKDNCRNREGLTSVDVSCRASHQYVLRVPNRELQQYRSVLWPVCAWLRASRRHGRSHCTRHALGGLPKVSLQKGGENGCCCLMAVRCRKVTCLDSKGGSEPCKQQLVPARLSPLKKSLHIHIDRCQILEQKASSFIQHHIRSRRAQPPRPEAVPCRRLPTKVQLCGWVQLSHTDFPSRK